MNYNNYICYTPPPPPSAERDPIYWMNRNGNGNKWTILARQYFAAVGDFYSFLTNRCCAQAINCTQQAYFQPAAVYNCFVYAQFALKTAFAVPAPGQIPSCGSSNNPAFNSSVSTSTVDNCITILDNFVTGNGGSVPHCDSLEGEPSSAEGTVTDPPSVAEQSGFVILVVAIAVFLLLFQGLLKQWLMGLFDQATRRRPATV